MIAVLVFAFALVVSSGVVEAKHCLRELESVNGKGLMGAFRPQCNSDGTWKPMQYHESYYFCVFPKTGEEIIGTRVRFNKPKSCEITRCRLEHHQGKKSGLLGAPTPLCDAEGKYEKLQCREGVCYCVNPETGIMMPRQDLSGHIPKCE